MSDKELQLRRAKSAMLSHDYDTAARLYKALISEDDSNPDLKMQLGNLYIKSGADKDALVCFEELLRLRPGSVDVLLALGGIYRRLGRFDESVETLQEAQATGEKSVQAAYSLGFTYRQMGRYDDAVACFQNVINANPRDVLAFNHLGAIHALQGDHETAISTYLRGLKVDQNHPVLQMNIAKSYESVGDVQKALTHYEAAMRSKPGWIEAIDAYSDLLLKQDRVKDADDVVSRTLKINPDDVKMHTAMGKIYNRQNIFDSAEEEFKKALSKDDEYTPALTGLALSQDRQGKHSEAAETIQKAGRISPDDVSILKQTANILLSANYLPAAYEKISHLWEINQDDVETVNLLGQYYICHGDDEKIEACFDKIERLAPNYTDVYKNWGERYMQIGDEKNAEDYLRAAVHENPSDPEAKIQLAGLYEVQGKNSEALDLLSEANRLDEHNVASRRRAEKIERKAARADSQRESAIDMAGDFDAPQESGGEISLGTDDDVSAGDAHSAGTAEAAPPQEEAAPAQRPEEQPLDADADEPFDGEPTADDVMEAPADDDSFSFDAFGTEDLSGGEDDVVSIDELIDEEPDDGDDFDTLIDDDSPVDDEDAPDLPGTGDPMSPVFIEEVLPPPSALDDAVDFPPAPEPPADDRHRPRPISDEAFLSLENQIRQIKSAAESASRTADQAWRAAQFASDYAKDMEKSLRDRLDEKIDDAISEKIGDELEEKIDDKLSETLDNFVTPPDPELAAGNADGQAESEADAMLRKAVETLPSIVRALEDREVEREFGISLEMFRKLREMLEFLPPSKKKQFMTSRNRLMLDYIIARLSGRPGLFATVTALLNSGLLGPRPTPTEEATSDITMDPSDDGEVIALVSSVMGTLRTLCESLKDDYLRDAIDTEILGLLDRIHAKAGGN